MYRASLRLGIVGMLLWASWGICASFAAVQAAAPKVSPFEMVRWNGQLPEVQINGAWYSPQRIMGVSIDKILLHARRQHGDRWDKRFCEDLPQLLQELDVILPTDLRVRLHLTEVGADEEIEKIVTMTADNRRRILDAGPRAGVQRARRKHGRGSSKFAFLTRRYRYAETATELTAEQAAQDLDQLEFAIADSYSYVALRKFNYVDALDTLRAALGQSIDIRDFHIQLRKMMALFGDGHTRVSGVRESLPQGWLGGAVVWIDGHYALLAPDGSAAFDGAPWIDRIDGLEPERWRQKAELLCARGSDAFLLGSSQYLMSAINFLRQELDLHSDPGSDGAPRDPNVSLELRTPDRKSRRVVGTEFRPRPSRSPNPLPTAHALLPGNVGYLRLPEMSHRPEFLDSLDSAMTDYKQTTGLIIDVRGNGGGSRDALLRLLPYFLEESETRVVNVAAYRIPAGTPPKPEGYLDNRFLYPLTSDHWSEQQREEVLKPFSLKFRPKWKLEPKGGFSDWHYFAISRSDNAKAYRYPNPGVILIDHDCFSATDIFVGAFKDAQQFTLMGTPTAGGSGRGQTLRLTHSTLRVRISSMASFRPNGHLYDGNGIRPDVVATLTLEDYTRGDKLDSVLEAARQRLTDGSK